MRASWISVSSTSDFSLQNLPFGVFSSSKEGSDPSIRHCATIVGDTVIDLALLQDAGLFHDNKVPWVKNQRNAFAEPTLNAFIEQPKEVWSAVRATLVELLADNGKDAALLRDNALLRQAALHPVDSVVLHLPFEISEYTDFYSSREHATNVGTMFRGKDNALQPNWLHLPVGYHGRKSTVCVSGHSFPRPWGQLQLDPSDASQGSRHAPCQLLDFELEVGTVVGGPPNRHGQPLTLSQAKDRIFGFVLLNDWSARDVQKFEYVPLGPFTSKNFCTTISPWIVTAEALQPFACETSAGADGQTDPKPLPYLTDPDYASYNVELTVALQTQQAAAAHTICRSNFRNLYWTPAQQLVHHSVTGCSMQPGDLLGSGTISGSTPDSYGSLLELSWKGSREVAVGDSGETRKFLRDGDVVVMKGHCGGGSGEDDGGTLGRVGFGECTATVLPALASPDETLLLEENKADEKTMERYTNFKLHGYWRSSCTWRVRIALSAKGIDYETIPVNLLQGENRMPAYLEKNPLGQVPLLECLDTVTHETISLTQSSAILDFLEDAFPHCPRLVPFHQAHLKGVARQMTELVNSGTQPLQNQIYLARLEEQSKGTLVAAVESKKVTEQGLAALEALVVQTQTRGNTTGGPYCMGTFAPTIADVYMVPQLYNARRFGVDVDTVCPTLVCIDQACSKHPWFVAARPEAQPDAPSPDASS